MVGSSAVVREGRRAYDWVYDVVLRHRVLAPYVFSVALVVLSFLLWYNFSAPPINSNIGFDLYPFRQVALSVAPTDPFIWPGSAVPWALGFPIELYYGSFYAASGNNYAVGVFLSAVVLDSLGVVALYYLLTKWLPRFGVRTEFGLFGVLIYVFNEYRLLNGWGVTDGYLSNGILSVGDPAILLVLTALTYLTLFRGFRYALLLGAFSFLAFANFPASTLILVQEYAAVLAVLLAFRWSAGPPLDRRAKVVRTSKSILVTLGSVLAANAYLLLPFSLVLGTYTAALRSSTPAYTFSYSFDSTQTIPNAIRLVTDWSVYSWKAPPWVIAYLNSPVAIALSFVVPFFALAATLFLRRFSDLFLYALMILTAFLSATVNGPFAPIYRWVTTNIPPFRAFYYGASFSPVLLTFYCFFAPVSIALLPGWIRRVAAWLAPAPRTPAPRAGGLSGDRVDVSRHRRAVAWVALVSVLILVASLPALTPSFSAEHATNYPIDTSLPGYYGAAADYLHRTDPMGPAMVFPMVEPFDSNRVNNSTWYSGINLYPDLIPNPSISSMYPDNYLGEDGKNLPVAGFLYDLGGSTCVTSTCLGGGGDALPSLGEVWPNASVEFATNSSTVVRWSAGTPGDNLSTRPPSSGATLVFRANQSNSEPNGHWLLGFLPSFENLDAYRFALVNYTLTGADPNEVLFGFHSYAAYGPGDAYALGNYTPVANGSYTSALIPLDSPTVRVGGSPDNVSDLFFVDDANASSGTVTLTVQSIRFLEAPPEMTPQWRVGTLEDGASLDWRASGVGLSFRVNASVYEPNGHWVLGYYPMPTNLSAFDYLLVDYNVSGLDASAVEVGYHSGIDYGPGNGFLLADYPTFADGQGYRTVVPLGAPSLAAGGTPDNVSNLFVRYAPAGPGTGVGWVNVSSIRLTVADPTGASALASGLARFGIEFAYVDTSVVTTNFPEYLGGYYNEVFGSSDLFAPVFHGGTVTIYRDLLYAGPVSSPETIAPVPTETISIGDLSFAAAGIYDNTSNAGVGYVPPSVAASFVGYAPATVASVDAVSPTEYTASVTTTSPSVLVFRESYSNDWVASLSNGSELPQHFIADGYANGWVVPSGHYQVTIRIPWSAAFAGIELATFAIPPLFVALFLVGAYRRRRRRIRARELVAPATSDDPGRPE